MTRIPTRSGHPQRDSGRPAERLCAPQEDHSADAVPQLHAPAGTGMSRVRVGPAILSVASFQIAGCGGSFRDGDLPGRG